MSMISETISGLQHLRFILSLMPHKNAERCIKTLSDAIDIIQSLSAKLDAVNMEHSGQYYKGGWIPITEQLPQEQGKYYIVTAMRRGSTCTTFAKWQTQSKSFDMRGRRSHWRIIAWMPMPESYRPKESEGENEQIKSE